MECENMKTSIPNITNVRLKDGGAQLYLLPKVEDVDKTDDPSVVAALEQALDIAIDNRAVSIIICMVLEGDKTVILDGGEASPATVGALELAKAKIVGHILDGV